MALVEAVIDFGEDQNLEGNEHIMNNDARDSNFEHINIVDQVRSQAYRRS